MKAVEVILYVFSVIFMLSLPVVFLPYSALNAIFTALGTGSYPPVPLVQYTVKTFLLLSFWLGVLLAIATRNPVAQEKALAVIGGIGLTWAVGCLVLGLSLDLPGFFYGDSLSSLVFGGLALLHRHHALRQAAV